MMRILRETFTGARVIRAFDKAAYEKERTDQTLTEYAKTMIKVNRLFAVLNPTVNLVMGLSISTILVYGGYQSLQGHLAIGSITAIIENTILSLWFLTMAAMVIVMVPKGLTSLQRIEEVLEEPIDLIDGDQTLNKSALSETIAAFNHVQFTYEGAEEPVLEDISFEIHRGKTTAIVGGTGSGKSTIAKALLRFKDVTAGSITLFGRNIKEISQAELRDQISYVPQKALLLSGTIQETLRFGNRPATHEAMAKAAEVAQAKSFIEGLPEGYESPVAQKGSNFSGGQKQRLSIARALTKPAEIYFFDDSFSALDYQTDANLRRALKEYTKDAAVIIVAQRVSTVKNADQIIVLDNGKMVGKGTHEELLRTCQTYQEFASSQGMGGMKDE
jgi:ATP-binding cassette subfamily B protein